MTASPRVHDLLRVSAEGVAALCDVANFSSISLRDFPFVVVRRAQQKDNLIPVGIRGMPRHERAAGWLAPEHITAVIAPESIELRQPLPDRSACNALLRLRQQWGHYNLTWGPGGSVGFQLLSGCHVVGDESDLDLVVRAHLRLSPQCLRMLAHPGDDLPCAVDVLVETPHGGFSPREYVESSARCLLRTVHGPHLVEDPWLPPTYQQQHL